MKAMTSTSKFKVRFIPLLSFLAVLLVGYGDESSAAGDRESETYTFVFASSLSPNTGNSQQLQWYMDEVEKRTDGRVRWQTHWAGSLLTSTELASGVADGRADAAFFASPYDAARFPLFNIGYIPLPGMNAIGGAETWRELNESSEPLQAEFEDAGVKMLVFNGVSNASNFATPEPITSMEEFQGLQIRFIGPITKVIENAGGIPIGISAEEVYSSMETGVIDAIGGYSMDSLVGSSLQEVAPWMHYLSPGYFASSLSMIFNLETWNSLPEDIQEVMLNVRDDYYEELPSMLSRTEKEACDALIEAGGGTLMFPQDQAEAAKWVQDIGDSVFEVWRHAAVEAGNDKASVETFEHDFRQTALSLSESADYTPGEELCAERTTVLE